MQTHKHNPDIISEEDFNLQSQKISTDPQEDSPGDSEQDAGDEISMGLNFKPIASEVAEENEIDEEKMAIFERPDNLVLIPEDPRFRIPRSAMIKSSELPSPAEDEDRNTSSN